MWSLIKWLALRFAAVRWFFKLGGMALLLPIALFLKTIGLPLLLVLGILALPVLFLLFVFGLPVFLVLTAGGAILGLLFAVLSIGLVVVKIALIVALPIFIMWKLVSWVFCRRKSNGSTTPKDGVDPA